jgi:DNA-binding NarL/FixJ family response regulator
MRLLHTDDYALFREGVHHILKQQNPNVAFFEAGDIQTTLDFLSKNNDLDLVLLDLYVSGENSLNALKDICGFHPDLPVVMLSASENPNHIKMALDSGAAGYIPKSASVHTLVNALNLVLEGGTYAPRIASQNNAQERTPQTTVSHQLTKRQSQVLALMAQGLPNKLIARKLFVSEATIKGHVTAILDIFGADNRVQAINKARQVGACVGAFMTMTALPAFE